MVRLYLDNMFEYVIDCVYNHVFCVKSPVGPEKRCEGKCNSCS